jgi:murein DD-endopeptidase MepM/ murein hydrolase activator NlpD
VSYEGDGTSNEQYFCYDKPVLAPASGQIVTVDKSVDDNVPGRMNPNQTAGNYVIINHGRNEYSVIAHFKKGSIVVSSGDSVLSGQAIGRSGNSGNSSEPYIHFPLQVSPIFGQGSGLPAQFRNYRANGQIVERGEPVQGEKVSSNTP